MNPTRANPVVGHATPSARPTRPPAQLGSPKVRTRRGPSEQGRRYAFALGGAGAVLLTTSIGIGIYNHLRYLDWQREANWLRQNPVPSKVSESQPAPFVKT